MSFFRSLRGSSRSSTSSPNPPSEDGLSPPTTTDEVDEPEAAGASAGGQPASSSSAPAVVPGEEAAAAAPSASPPEGGGDADAENVDAVPAEDEPGEDPVRAKLEGEVRQRDAAISALEKARLEKQQELTALDKDLEQERMVQMKEALVHKIESERIKRQTAHTEERLKALEQDMQDKAAIHEYANLIKGVAPKGGVDSQYVTKLQSQLQKAVKKMESTSDQMKELEELSRVSVDGLTADIAQLVEERCRTELELRKQMEVLQEQKKEMQLEYEKRIRDNLKTLQALRAKAASQVTIEELEDELLESDQRLVELDRIHDKQTKTIEQLNKSLAAEGGL